VQPLPYAVPLPLLDLTLRYPPWGLTAHSSTGAERIPQILASAPGPLPPVTVSKRLPAIDAAGKTDGGHVVLSDAKRKDVDIGHTTHCGRYSCLF
jgi:hypothetical protein